MKVKIVKKMLFLDYYFFNIFHEDYRYATDINCNYIPIIYYPQKMFANEIIIDYII